jgi:hypothetical protein
MCFSKPLLSTLAIALGAEAAWRAREIHDGAVSLQRVGKGCGLRGRIHRRFPQAQN